MGGKMSNEYYREYYLKNREKKLIYAKKYAEENVERLRLYRKNYATANPEKESLWKYKWRKKNHIKCLLNSRIQSQYNRNRTMGKLSIDFVLKIYQSNIDYFGSLTCDYCKTILSFENATLDHINPINKHGGNAEHNLCVACKKCNFSKQDKTLIKWLFFQASREAKRG